MAWITAPSTPEVPPPLILIHPLLTLRTPCQRFTLQHVSEEMSYLNNKYTLHQRERATCGLCGTITITSLRRILLHARQHLFCLYHCQCSFHTNSRDWAYTRITTKQKKDPYHRDVNVIHLVDEDNYPSFCNTMKWMLSPQFKLAPKQDTGQEPRPLSHTQEEGNSPTHRPVQCPTAQQEDWGECHHTKVRG